MKSMKATNIGTDMPIAVKFAFLARICVSITAA